MSKNDIERRIKKAIVDNGEGVSIENITDTSNLVSDFSYDSIEIIQLVVALEDLFDIEFDDEELDVSIFAQYSKLVETVEKKLA